MTATPASKNAWSADEPPKVAKKPRTPVRPQIMARPAPATSRLLRTTPPRRLQMHLLPDALDADPFRLSPGRAI
jgi:hypothetical protein